MTKHLLPIALTLTTLTQPTIAQIIPDNTTPTTLTTEATLDRISGQPLTPNATNLFHSFEQFSLDTEHTAQFEIPNDTITTILTRITGTTPSQIDGTLIVDGNVDLFFLNPNGIDFGENSRIQTNGDLILTTADRIQFGDDLSFAATDTTTNPALLSLLTPTGLQFGNTPGAIVNRSQTFGADTDPINATTIGAPLGISVQPDRALLVFGGDITLDGGSFSAIDGALELVSLQHPGQITLEHDHSRYRSDTVLAETLGTITLSRGAIAEVSGHLPGTFGEDDPGGQGGDLRIVSDQLLLQDGSGIDVATYSGLGTDTIIHTQTIEITEESGIYVSAENLGTNGTFTIQTRDLSLAGGGEISAAMADAGSGGLVDITAQTIQITGLSASTEPRTSSLNINMSPSVTADSTGGTLRIQANTIELEDGGEIGSTNQGAGQGGSIAIQADTIAVRGAATTPAGEIYISWISAISEGGATGTIQLRANTLELDQLAQIAAAVSGAGESQGMTFEVGELTLRNGAQILASSNNAGRGGDVTIVADTITIAGTSADGSFPSGIIVQTRGGAPGFSSTASADSGNLTLTTDRLTVSDGGAISADTFGTGNAGILSIAANDAVVQGQAAIAAVPFGNDTGFNLGVSPVRDGSNRLPSRITAFTAGLGNGGNVQINTDQLTVRDGGRIEVGATVLTTTADQNRVGNAGDLLVTSDRLQLDRGVIRADTISGDSGNISMNTRDLWLDRRSRITTNATGSSIGGNIAIDTETLVAFEDSDISANAEADFGGRIRIAATGIFGTTYRDDLGSALTSDITATSALGPQFYGIVTLETPAIRADEGVSLPTTLAEAPLRQTACDTQPGDRPSELVVTGRGGLPPRATQHLMFDLDALFPAWASAPGVSTPVVIATDRTQATPIAEAQGLYRSPQGSIALYAAMPPQPLTCSW